MSGHDDTVLVFYYLEGIVVKGNFVLSDKNNDAEICFNDVKCSSEKLIITKYDVNFVEGLFEFDLCR